MQFNLGAIVGVVEHGIEKVWPGIVTHADSELHKVVKFTDAGTTVLHDVEGVADLAAARDPQLAANNAHVIIPLDAAPAADEIPDDELVDEPADAAAPVKKATAKKAAA